MKIKGTISYWDGSEVKVAIESEEQFSAAGDQDIIDAVSYALFGKTVYHEIIHPKKGPPLIILSIENNGREVYIVRQPQYPRETHFGTKYLSKDVCSIKTEKEEYDSLDPEKYYMMLDEFLDISEDDFALKCKE